jgi:hypothetical protein
MYKRTSLQTGGSRGVHQKHRPKRVKEHGEIVIRMLAGERLDPPLRLPGDWSSQAECDYCHEFFCLKDSTVAIVLLDDYVKQLFDPVRRYRLFCCENHADNWEVDEECRRKIRQKLDQETNCT